MTPSLTEILFALGLGDSVAGVTDACDYLREARQKPHVHSWFDPDMDRICDLAPDLILGLESAHLNLKRRFEEKCEGVPFVLTHPSSGGQALGDIAFLGNLLGVPERAQRLLTALKERLAWVDDCVHRIFPDRRPSVSRVLEWTEDRLIVAGPLPFQGLTGPRIVDMVELLHRTLYGEDPVRNRTLSRSTWQNLWCMPDPRASSRFGTFGIQLKSHNFYAREPAERNSRSHKDGTNKPSFFYETQTMFFMDSISSIHNQIAQRRLPLSVVNLLHSH